MDNQTKFIMIKNDDEYYRRKIDHLETMLIETLRQQLEIFSLALDELIKEVALLRKR